MSLIRCGLFGVVLLFPFLARAVAGPVESAPAKSAHVTATLVADARPLQPGDRLTVALRLRMDPKWHTYWTNPGDAGIPTRIEWTLPPGLKAGEIEWPAPRLLSQAPLMDYGYEGETWLLTELKVTGPVAWPLQIGATAKWLECAEICIPGKADLTLTLPAPKADAKETKPSPALQAAWAAIPKLLPASATLERDGDDYQVTIAGEAPDFPVRFLPLERGWIDNAAPQLAVRTGQGMTIRVKRDANAPALENGKTFSGVVVGLPPGAKAPKGWLVDCKVIAPPPAPAPKPPAPPFPWLSLLFAFVGGLILNLMPCVLPVLALKVLALAGHQGEAKASRRGGIEFTLGVVVSFWALAGLLLVFRAAGEKLGWGFQLQSPSFIVLLAALFVLIGLNLFGLFEVGTKLMGWSGSLASSGAGRMAFGSGVLAVAVATPCTAPFMGTALAAAFSQPAWVAFLIFTSLGLGMAAPYLVLAANPAWLRFVPKPGAWMVTFRQFLGFPMLLTALWLVWVYERQRGGDAGVVLTGALLLVALGAWIYGKWDAPEKPDWVRALAGIVAVVLIGTALTFAMRFGATHVAVAEASPSADGVWQPYDVDKIAALRAQGKPVFVDFTAAWCLSCQVNQRVALDRPEVLAKFREKGVALFKADWTSSDPAITAALAALGRQSVPVYALYAPGSDAPRLLPEVLTPGIVLGALDALPSSPPSP